jgi:hypothetical protein
MIELRPLDALDATLVASTQAETAQRIVDDNPSLDLRRGVFDEILVDYHGILATQQRMNVDDYLAGRSLLAITADPTLADPDLVDDVLSNYRVVRRPGTRSAGEVAVILSDSVSVTIAGGSVWQSGGLLYRTPRVYTARSDAGQIIDDGDRLLRATGDGNFVFTIEIVAEADGPEYEVRKDTTVVPVAVPRSYVNSYAASDFSAGRLIETNQELLDRLNQGAASKTLSNRVGMIATLTQAENFPTVVADSVVGGGDAELTRSARSILPIALPGYCDWYVRTAVRVSKTSLVPTATLIEKNTDGTGVWQFAVGKADAPGFYEVTDIRPDDDADRTGGYAIVSDVRGLDLTGEGFLPDVVDATEAAYSAFSTAVVQFLDTSDHAALTVGDRRTYRAAALGLPDIAAIQEFASDRGRRPHGADILVKAPVPCFVAVTLTVYKRRGQADPDTDAIRQAVADSINAASFVGEIYASQIQAAFSGLLLDGQANSAIDMLGRLRYPDGTVEYVRNSEVLVAPAAPAAMVSDRTVQFFADPTAVAVNVTTRPGGT